MANTSQPASSSSVLSSNLDALTLGTNDVGGQWLDLPVHLTEEILVRLSIIDYIRFGAICRRWRSIQKEHCRRHGSMMSLPWYIPHRPEQETVICTFGPLNSSDIGQRSHCLRIPLSTSYQKYLKSERLNVREGPSSSALPYGWLLLDDHPSWWTRHREYKFTLLNPLTGVQFPLPWLGSLFYDYKATMSPPRDDCAVLVITADKWGNKLHMHRRGDEKWISLRPSDWERGFANANLAIERASAIFWEGKFYCMFFGVGLQVIDPHSPDFTYKTHDFEMDQSQLPSVKRYYDDDVEYWTEIFLVESNGKLLLVVKFFAEDLLSADTTPTLKKFELFEASLPERRWVRVESLGDRVVLIYRRFVVSLVAANVGVKENCIYALEQSKEEEEEDPKSWSVFDLGTEKLMDSLLPCPPSPSTHLLFLPCL